MKIAVSLTLMVFVVPEIRAQESAGSEISPTSPIPITSTYDSVDNNFCYKNYEVEAARGGKYYAEFWLLPARYADGSYTTFTVYVNGELVGKINPKAGNWQSARIGNSETIALSEGKNVISIATAAQVRKIIAETAKKIGNKPYNVNKTYGSWNQWYGYGLVNAYEAVKKANGI